MQPHTSFRRYIAALTVGGFITALLLFALPTYAAAHSGQANPTPTPTLTIPTPTPTPVPPTPVAITPTPTVQQPTSISDCPGAILNATGPSIEFCSPRFKGDVEGPFGSHITLLGRNFPSMPTGLYLLQVPDTKLPISDIRTAANICNPHPSTLCFLVDNSQVLSSEIKDIKRFKLTFNWTIQGAPINGDYYAVLTYNAPDQNGKVHETFAFSPLYRAFTLLSSNAPCITIWLDPHSGPRCPGLGSTQQLTVGSTVYIHGENWNSGSYSQIINVELNTCQQSRCQRGSQTLLTQQIPANSDGSFTSSISLKQGLVGDYWITASNHVPDNVNSNGISMMADKALTFGHKDQGDALALHLNIVRPCIMVTSNDPSHTTPPEQTPSNCTKPSSQPIAVTAGSTFYIQGFDWLASQKQKVTVKISCAQSGCAGQKLVPQIGPFPLQQNVPGYFYQTINVPTDSAGTYAINVTQDTISYMVSLTIQINTPSSTLPLLALLPALVSLLLYIIMQRQRTVQAAAATRRMPGGPGPTTARSSLPPPVIRQQPGGRR